MIPRIRTKPDPHEKRPLGTYRAASLQRETVAALAQLSSG